MTIPLPVDMSTTSIQKTKEKKMGKPTTPHKYGKMISKYGLTSKQERFVMAYIDNGGNATKAVHDSYDPTDEKTAQSIGSENLSRPIVREALKEILWKQRATAEFAAAGFVSMAEQSTDERTRLRAYENVAKMNSMFREHKTIDANVKVVAIGLPVSQLGGVIDATLAEDGQG